MFEVSSSGHRVPKQLQLPGALAVDKNGLRWFDDQGSLLPEQEYHVTPQNEEEQEEEDEEEEEEKEEEEEEAEAEAEAEVEMEAESEEEAEQKWKRKRKRSRRRRERRRRRRRRKRKKKSKRKFCVLHNSNNNIFWRMKKIICSSTRKQYFLS